VKNPVDRALGNITESFGNLLSRALPAMTIGRDMLNNSGNAFRHLFCRSTTSGCIFKPFLLKFYGLLCGIKPPLGCPGIDTRNRPWRNTHKDGDLAVRFRGISFQSYNKCPYRRGCIFRLHDGNNTINVSGNHSAAVRWKDWGCKAML
jgi:hypothetical protein